MTLSNLARTTNEIDAGGDRHGVSSTPTRLSCNSIARIVIIVICTSLIALTPSHRAQAAEPAAGEAVTDDAAQVRPDTIATTGQTPVMLTVEGDRLSAKISKAPLRIVLARVAEETRIKIFVASTVPNDELSDTFDGLRLDAAIKRLLGNRGYALRYAQAKGDANGSGDGHLKIAELYVVPPASGDTKPYGMEQVGQTTGQGFDPNPEQTRADIESADAVLLAKALESEQAADRIAALKKYLDEAEQPDYQSVAKALKDPDRKVRELALGGMEDSNTLPADATAEVALADGVPALRKRALEILVERKGGAVRTTLARALEDPDPAVRAHAQEMAQLADKIDAFRAQHKAEQAR
jgi:hypothetical protein